jgi:hypothetical protein
MRLSAGILAAGLVAMTACQSSSGGFSSRSTGDNGAYNACKTFVKDKLRAPSTAKFADHSVTHTGSEYTVTGSVDAQNGFGAQIRSTYTCTVTDTGESWHLENVDVATP